MASDSSTSVHIAHSSTTEHLFNFKLHFQSLFKKFIKITGACLMASVLAVGVLGQRIVSASSNVASQTKAITASADDSALWLDLLLILLLILVNGFFSASEMAVVTLNSNKIRREAESNEKNKTARQLLHFVDNKSGFLATIQVAITFAGFLSSAFGATKIAPKLYALIDPAHTAPYLLSVATVVVTILLSICSLVLGELVPKRIGLANPEKYASRFVKVLKFSDLLFRPFAWLLNVLANLFCKLFGLQVATEEQQVSEEEIRLLAAVGRDNGVIQSTEAEMIDNIFELDDKQVSEIMTPRTAMVTLHADASYAETIDVAANERYSRIPVYEDDIDDIIGILHIKDLLTITDIEKEHFNLRRHLRTTYFVPESKSVNLAIREMQQRNVSLAIVVDEYGGTDGMITVEDVLEEIVGEIHDEYDEHASDIEQNADGSYTINGLRSIEDVARIFHELEELEDDETFDTIAGFVLSLLERIPEPDEQPQVSDRGLTFTVLEMDDRRIAKIRIERNNPENLNEEKLDEI